MLHVYDTFWPWFHTLTYVKAVIPFTSLELFSVYTMWVENQNFSILKFFIKQGINLSSFRICTRAKYYWAISWTGLKHCSSTEVNLHQHHWLWWHYDDWHQFRKQPIVFMQLLFLGISLSMLSSYVLHLEQKICCILTLSMRRIIIIKLINIFQSNWSI